MIRYLQSASKKPVKLMKVSANMKTGSLVSQDFANDEADQQTSGLGDCLVDVAPNYDGVNSVIPKNDTEDSIVSGKLASIISPAVGERYAVDQINKAGLLEGYPLNAGTGGKFVKGSASSSYKWVYGGEYNDVDFEGGIVQCVKTATSGTQEALTYDANSGTGTLADANSPYFVGYKAIAADPTGSITRTGYTFSKWNTAAEGTGTDYDPGDEVTMSADVTLYAQWTAAGE